ncbi:src domain protein [Pelomyxa schiedti]|nr:src domain protein [Pelomyxa schiedti]
MNSELADGCVLSLIRTEELPLSMILEFIRDVSEGMTYLVEHNVIHRDLAARNLLYITSGSGYNVKIADFGLSVMHTNTSTSIPSQNEVSVRWSSLETLTQGVSTTKSDVWSFGVLVWELLTSGKQPYSNLSTNSDVYQYILSGNRLQQPDGCPSSLWKLLERCWNSDASFRPEFEVFSVLVSELLLLPPADEDNYTTPKTATPHPQSSPSTSTSSSSLSLSSGSTSSTTEPVVPQALGASPASIKKASIVDNGIDSKPEPPKTKTKRLNQQQPHEG